jgi:SAM-dependent methyltransferase
MLDIACGTGVVAREAARRNVTAQVSGLDMNPQMVEVAAARSEDEGLPIAWHVGKADTLPFEDRSFDLVTIQQAFQFFPDKPAALAEIRRVLRPGGTFALNIWASHDRQGINGAFADSVASVTGAASMHTPYAMGDMSVISDLLTDAGFAVDSIELVEIECTWSPVDGFVELLLESVSAGVPAMHGRTDEERAALAAAIADDMSDALAQYTVGDQIVTPSTSNIVLSHTI